MMPTRRQNDHFGPPEWSGVLGYLAAQLLSLPVFLMLSPHAWGIGPSALWLAAVCLGPGATLKLSYGRAKLAFWRAPKTWLALMFWPLLVRWIVAGGFAPLDTLPPWISASLQTKLWLTRVQWEGLLVGLCDAFGLSMVVMAMAVAGAKWTGHEQATKAQRRRVPW